MFSEMMQLLEKDLHIGIFVKDQQEFRRVFDLMDDALLAYGASFVVKPGGATIKIHSPRRGVESCKGLIFFFTQEEFHQMKSVEFAYSIVFSADSFSAHHREWVVMRTRQYPGKVSLLDFRGLSIGEEQWWNG